MSNSYSGFNTRANVNSTWHYQQSVDQQFSWKNIQPSISRSQVLPVPATPVNQGTPRTYSVPLECFSDRPPKDLCSPHSMYSGPNTIKNSSPAPYAGISCTSPQSYKSKWMAPYKSGQIPMDNLGYSSPLSWSCHTPATGSPEFIRTTQHHFNMNCSSGYNIAKEPSVAAALDRIRLGGITSPVTPRPCPSFIQMQQNSPRCHSPQVKSKSCHDTLGIKPVPDLSPRFDAIIAGNIPLTPKIPTNFSRTPVLAHGETQRYSSNSPGRKRNLDSQSFYGESRDNRSPQFLKHINSSPRKMADRNFRHSTEREPLGRHEDRYSRRKFKSKRHYGDNDDEYDKNEGSSRRREYRCYSPPFPEVVRQLRYHASDKYYRSSQSFQEECSTVVGTEKIKTLCEEFKQQIKKVKLVGEKDQHISEPPVTGTQDKESEEQQVTDELEDEVYNCSDDSDDESDDESSSSVAGMEMESNAATSSDDEVTTKPRAAAEEYRKRKLSDLLRLHPELWFNEEEQTNDGPVCRCSKKDRKKGIRHSVYPGEKDIPKCFAMGNNSSQLHSYWIAITPHTNFMMEHPTVITASGKEYTFEGFSILSHKPIEQVPLCTVIRFNIEYSIHLVHETVPENFCICEVDAFSKYLFHDILELFDWHLHDDCADTCQKFHFLPRFIHKCKKGSDIGKEVHEILSMAEVLNHLIKNSEEPLIQSWHYDLSDGEWEKYACSCINSVVTTSGKKPGAVRIDNVKFDQGIKRSAHQKVYPYVIHNGIRPVQMSYAGCAKYQQLWKSYVKLRNKIANRPLSSRKDHDSLIKLKIELEKIKMKSSMRRDVLVRMSSKGLMKTGLCADVCQHALMLPVLVHHLCYHACLETLDDRLGYKFNNRSLLQLALTHPSYHLNFGVNPDQARNSLANCGVRQPRYGNRRIHHVYRRKRGIMQLTRVMSNLGMLEEHQSMIRHNERLEFLGDAVLEFICSVHLYYMFPDKSEGNLAMFRSALVQNKNLSQLAKKIDLSDYMQFSHGPDLCQEEDMDHAMANCLEALLGAVFLEGGISCATKLFCELAFDDEDLRDVWLNVPKHPLQKQQPGGDRHFIDSSPLLQKLVQFEDSTGIEFFHIRLLARAFTHPQVGFNNLTLGNNQRMEFLGDSILQFVVSVFLYKHFPEHHEGHLTLLRSSLVNSQTQATVARELGLAQYINFGKREVQNIGQKLLADVLEAFIAALFVDKGLEHVEVFCKVCIFPRLEDFIINQDWIDAKSQLQQGCLSLRGEGQLPILPEYKILSDKGPAHHKKFSVGVYFRGKRIGTGEGQSIQQAEMAAAKDGLSSAYFPELARQKKLLDRKHGYRRRNYCYRSPRTPKASKNDDPRDVGPVDGDEKGDGGKEFETGFNVSNKKVKL